MNEMENKKRRHGTIEDMAMKSAAQFFGEELLPILGIREKISYEAPTESISLEKRHLYQDFNYMTEKGEMLHFEFESDSLRREDLRRFREYEASTSRTHKCAVITYVICTSPAERIMEGIWEGINYYRVRIVRLKEWKADGIFRKLGEKRGRGETLEKQELVSMLLTPLMSGEMPQEERFFQGFQYLKEEEEALGKEMSGRMQSVFYAFAEKLLNNKELEKIKEMVTMTVLGEMICSDAKAQGIEEGIQKGIQKGQRALIESMKELGISKEKAIQKISEKFRMTYEAAGRTVEEYWN